MMRLPASRHRHGQALQRPPPWRRHCEAGVTSVPPMALERLGVDVVEAVVAQLCLEEARRFRLLAPLAN